MFGFIARWLDHRRENSRKIFSYWDGQRTRRIDPMQAARALDGHPTFVPKVHLMLLEKGDKDGIDVTLQATRDVFGVKEWSESQPGLTEAETLQLLDDFAAYNESLKKKHSQSPTLFAPTEKESSTDGDLDTPSTSDSGSTSSESSSAVPLAS